MPLSQQQIDQFETDGYIVLRNAFDGARSTAWVHEECEHMGVDLDKPATWEKPYFRLSTQRREKVDEFSPVAWEAACELLGGRDRITKVPNVDLFAVNLYQGAERPFQGPNASSPGWHKDGWHFRHFLDSHEQGLLGIPLHTDVHPRGGATFIAAGSVGPVSRFLADHPEGVLPNDFPVRELLAKGVTFLEATGNAGDFYLLHPFLLHAVSQNVLRLPRAISNILYELDEPMNFDRSDGAYSPVEKAILRGLGLNSCPFSPTTERFRTPDYGPIPG